MKIKKGDQVQILSGKDRGKRGTVVLVLPQEDRVVVEGVNIMKRHTRAKSDTEKGERIEKPAPLHVSNVMLVDKETGKPTRVGYRFEGTEKVRVSKRSGKPIVS
ncbi:MAG: 50S ribosomal protein L24 [Candidatus Moraniibacteriota bacterium]|nr:MAG: 50S ribosomal protein L24 [Candidatus Moranbacteria bacterium]